MHVTTNQNRLKMRVRGKWIEVAVEANAKKNRFTPLNYIRHENRILFIDQTEIFNDQYAWAYKSNTFGLLGGLNVFTE